MAYPFGFPVVYESSNGVHNHGSNNVSGSSNSDYYLPKNVALPAINNSVISTEVNVMSSEDLIFFARLAENTWRQITMSDTATRENSGGATGNTVNSIKTINSTSTYFFPSKNNSIVNSSINVNINTNNSSNININNLVTSTGVSSPTGSGGIAGSLNTNHIGSPIVIGKMTVSTEDR